jgi:predicted dehydrogenase
MSRVRTEPLRGVLVGCGFFGRILLEAWLRVEGARIVAVCDRDAARAQAAASAAGVPRAYAELADAIAAERPDFVDIATRPVSHLALVERAANAGCHVLCQKPLAPTWEESVAVVEAAEAAGVRLMANENWRWQPWFRALRALLDAGAIGPPHTLTYRHRAADALLDPPFPNQPYFCTMPRFLLLETVVHFIDTARFLLGGIESVWCRTRRVSGVTVGEDAAVVVLTFHPPTRNPGLPAAGDGPVAIIDASRCAEDEEEGPAFGHVGVEGPRGTLRVLPSGRIRHKPLFAPERELPIAIPAEGYRGDSVRATHQHFVDAMSAGTPFETEGRAYLRTVRAVFAAYESAETGATVRV